MILVGYRDSLVSVEVPRDTGAPTVSCHTVAQDFIRDIEDGTHTCWDDAGRITLTHQHLLGPAKKRFEHCIQRLGRTEWKKLKDAFLEAYPRIRTYEELQEQLKRLNANLERLFGSSSSDWTASR